MIVVIADDLSGAAELGGAARLHGLSAEVQTRFAPESAAEVVCLATGSRALPVQAAAAAAALAMHQVVSAGPEHVFLKFDSVLRGHIIAELRAAMAAAGARDAVLVTANPTRGRVIRDGRYLIDGTPLDATGFANDPEYPRATASVAELLGGDTAGVSTPDVSEPADLHRIAGGVGSGTLAAGSAEFFVALLERWKGAARTTSASTDALATRPGAPAEAGQGSLLVCGSLASWAIRREEAESRRVKVFELCDDVAGVVRALATEGVALVGIGRSAMTAGVAPAELVGALADRVVAITTEIPIDRLLLEGGATAAAVVRRLGFDRMTVLATGDPGFGALRPIGVERPILLIKPGSYPWPEGVW